MFAGYKFPHPLEYHIFIKVQTMGKKPPREAFDDSLTDLIGELQDIRDKFQVRYASFKKDLLVGLGMTGSPRKIAYAHLLPPSLVHKSPHLPALWNYLSLFHALCCLIKMRRSKAAE